MAEITITTEVRDFIREWKGKQGNLIMVLQKVQEHYGYIPRDIVFEVAELLEVPVAKIYGVITFYHLFKLSKPGKFQIAVCMGTACYLKGGENLILELERQLGVGINTVTEDGLFSVEAVRCIGCCGLAPALTINGEAYGNVQTKELPGILEEFRSNQ